MFKQTIKLGPATIDIAVGDADHNGCLDVKLDIAISGWPFGLHFPPVNLNAELAKSVGDAFAALASKVQGKK